MKIANTIKVLKDLLKINNERVADYKKASVDVKEADLKPVLQDIAEESRKNATELTNEIEKAGGVVDPVVPTAAIQKAWLEFKSAFTGRGFESVLDSFEDGEDIARKGYTAAIASSDLSSEVRQLVRNQEAGIKISEDQVKNYRENH